MFFSLDLLSGANLEFMSTFLNLQESEMDHETCKHAQQTKKKKIVATEDARTES